MKFINLAHGLYYQKYQTAIIVSHNYRLEMGHPRTSRAGRTVDGSDYERGQPMERVIKLEQEFCAARRYNSEEDFI